MIHQVAMGLKPYHVSGVQSHLDLYQIGITVDSVLPGGEVNGKQTILRDGIAGVHILKAAVGQKGCRRVIAFPAGEGLLANRARAEQLKDLTALFGHLDIELVGGQGALTGRGESKDIAAQAEKGGGGLFGSLFVYLRHTFQHSRGAVGQVFRKRAVINQSGYLGKICLGSLESGTTFHLFALLACGDKPLPRFLYALRFQRACTEICLDAFQHR